MAISFFTGLMGGVIVGYATKGQTSFCTFMREQHPTLLKGIGITLLLVLVIVPTVLLTGAVTVNSTPFFWGGCAAINFVYGFFIVQCTQEPSEQKA